MKKLIIGIIGLLISGMLVNQSAFGQCKNFTKNKCLPELSPYIFNGQMNATILNEGDIAELVLTFYANQDYRLMICSENQLGEVAFRLYDTQDKLLFNNKDFGSAKMWDFSSTATQQIRIEVEVPENIDLEKPAKSGCVSILVGFKDKE